MTRILLLRHGQSTWNAEGRWQGWADPPLSPLGAAEAGLAADAIAAWGVEMAPLAGNSACGDDAGGSKPAGRSARPAGGGYGRGGAPDGEGGSRGGAPDGEGGSRGGAPDGGSAEPAGGDQRRVLGPVGRGSALSAGSVGIDVVVSSDLGRARDTAGIIADRLALGPVESYPGLRERDVGEFTGLTRAEIDRRWPGLVAPHTPLDPPGGESSEALLARAVATLHRLAETHADRIVLAVSHGALIRALERHLGVDHGPTPNLAGRWLMVGDANLRAGARAALLGGDSQTMFS